MPYKHQAASYRTIDGKRWESWGDFCKEAAESEKEALKRDGWKVRKVALDDGMVRIFRWKDSSSD